MVMSLAVCTPQAVTCVGQKSQAGKSRAHGLPMCGARIRLMTCRPQPYVHIATRAESDPEGSEGPVGKKFITREEEPEEYWTSKAEREGESPMKDPMAWIGLTGIFLPFVILGVAIAVGYVEVNP